MWRFGRAAFVVVVVVAVAVAVVVAVVVERSGTPSRLTHRTLVAPLRVRQEMRAAMAEYGRPHVIFTGIRHVAYAGDGHTPMYGFVVTGRFVVVGPPSPGRKASRTVYDRGAVIVDAAGAPIGIQEWASGCACAAQTDCTFRRKFASTT
jgi:hypothetical protein